MEQVRAFFGLLEELEAQVQDHQHIVPPQQTLKSLGRSRCANAAGCEQLTYRSLKFDRISQGKVTKLEDVTSSLSYP